jgi:diguanylate cyclase (GGDEF)-like protein
MSAIRDNIHTSQEDLRPHKIESINIQNSEETDADRRRGILADDALSLDLVSALSGDRPLTETETIHLHEIKEIRGSRFYCDLLYSITHQYFPPESAEDLWSEVLRHKTGLSTTLGRNVRIVVAALDYLSNITANMDSATLVDEANIEEIVELSLRDGLTGLFNHTYFYQQVDFEVKRYIRYGSLVTLLLIDIDDFKKVNDTFGHREGDRILSAMGRTLLRAARDSDVCCRYGGEEFAVILPLTNVQEAEWIANRLNKDLAEQLPDGKMVTVSIGVASCGNSTESYRDIVEKADEALYRVKRSGKNQVVVATHDE